MEVKVGNILDVVGLTKEGTSKGRTLYGWRVSEHYSSTVIPASKAAYLKHFSLKSSYFWWGKGLEEPVQLSNRIQRTKVEFIDYLRQDGHLLVILGRVTQQSELIRK